MKKLYFTLFVSLFAFALVWANDSERIIKPSELPQRAQQFIKRYYSMACVIRAVYDEDIFSKEYEVWIEGGVHLEFAESGDWIDVEAQTQVPDDIVPAPIAIYVSRHHPQSRVVRIERDKHGYEVVLSDHRELKFNNRFKLVEVD